MRLLVSCMFRVHIPGRDWSFPQQWSNSVGVFITSLIKYCSPTVTEDAPP